MSFKNVIRICLILFCLPFQGCLKDSKVESPEFSFNQSEEILHYLESQGDFINSSNCPATIDADEVYKSDSSYLLIDIRPAEEYALGHIENSINISHNSLLSSLDSVQYQNYKKVVIISRNGQSSAYYTSLLRIAGYSNVYSLYYGLAGWNPDFANDWFGSLFTMVQKEEFSADEFGKNNITSLPDISYNSGLNIKEKIKSRADHLLNMEYSENTNQESDSFISIGREPFMKRFGEKNDYLVWLTNNDGYTYILGPNNVIKHLKGAVQYMHPQYSDFKSTKYLQTIPKERKTIIICYDGVLSAFFTAYLNFLGYDTASFLFGLNALSYDYLNIVPAISKYSFNSYKVRSYPYVK